MNLPTLLVVLGSLISATILGALIFLIVKGVSFAWSNLSGWKKISDVYPDITEAKIIAIKRRVLFGTRDTLKLNYIFDVESTDKGLRFRCRSAMKNFPNAFIPWLEFQGPLNSTPLGYLSPEIIFTTTKLPQIRFRFTHYTAEWIRLQREINTKT